MVKKRTTQNQRLLLPNLPRRPSDVHDDPEPVDGEDSNEQSLPVPTKRSPLVPMKRSLLTPPNDKLEDPSGERVLTSK